GHRASGRRIATRTLLAARFAGRRAHPALTRCGARSARSAPTHSAHGGAGGTAAHARARATAGCSTAARLGSRPRLRATGSALARPSACLRASAGARRVAATTPALLRIAVVARPAPGEDHHARDTQR